ncbi:MAG: glycosyltransferase family 39 protein [Candidatus Omnitrophica bacterium]|nr:glycosyltransferase family 39 protein [Candidatus Omnitrophota bacterium]MCM8790642.1 glycosyltransferase family 39 protein [Candidatus Omnitrophota bacterium]
MREKFYLIFSAIILGVLGYFMTGAMFLFLVFGVILYAIYRNTPLEDRKFVIGVLIAGFTLRVILAVALHAYFYTKGFHSTSGDDLLYIVKSLALVHKWEGRPYTWVWAITGKSFQYGSNPFTYLVALFYKIFGFHPVVSKLINCIIGTLVGWLSYLIAKKTFNNSAARIAMLVTVFYPSLVRWSVANLKDPLLIFLFTACIYLFIDAIYGRVSVWKMIILVGAMTTLYFFSQIFYFTLIVLGATMMLVFKIYAALCSKIQKGIFTTLMVLAVIILVGYMLFVKYDKIIDAIYLCYDTQIAISQSDFAGYQFYPGEFMVKLSRGVIDVPQLIMIMAVDIIYFMLSPFPWQMISRSRIFAFPQMLLWYMVLLLSILGYFRLLLKKPDVAVLVGMLLVIGIGVNSMAEGNIGSAFRHRDLYSPLFIVLASAILDEFIRTKELKLEG